MIDNSLPRIISASRRTDIPAFYTEWLLNRFKAGYAAVRHPYTGRPSRVSLRTCDLAALVFWSKNYSPLLGKIEAVEAATRNLYFHFTITSTPELEVRVPPARDAIRDYKFLAKRYTPDHLVWRFDPVCIMEGLPFELYEERFRICAENLRGYAGRCIISFVSPYKKVLARMRAVRNQDLLDISLETKRSYALRLATRAEAYGIQLYACCNDFLLSGAEDEKGNTSCEADLLSPPGMNAVQTQPSQEKGTVPSVKKARCIDGGRLGRLFSSQADDKPAATRKQCACTKSIDIGAYDTCGHGCLYCYANTDDEKAVTALRNHDPDREILA